MAGEPPTNAEIADRLQLLGDLLEIEGATSVDQLPLFGGLS